MLDEVAAGWPSAVTPLDATDAASALDDAEVKERMNGNLCRCGAYSHLVPRDRRSREPGPVKPFRYERPADVGEAIALLDGASERARFLGGGTNLVDLMKLGVETPDVLVDVNRLGLDGITRTDGGGVRIGAGTRNSDLAVDKTVRREHPVLSEALLAGASGQLRNMATVGGNLLQRTRCRYFQDVTKPCNKRRPGSGCPAIAGEHHNLAILGASSECVATHPSDMAVAMAALDAVVHVHGVDGERAIPMHEFHRLPGDRPDVDTTLAPGELIVAVELPPAVATRRSRYRKVRERASYAFAVVSVAASPPAGRRRGGRPGEADPGHHHRPPTLADRVRSRHPCRSPERTAARPGVEPLESVALHAFAAAVSATETSGGAQRQLSNLAVAVSGASGGTDRVRHPRRQRVRRPEAEAGLSRRPSPCSGTAVDRST